jgi:hypothetical protein
MLRKNDVLGSEKVKYFGQNLNSIRSSILGGGSSFYLLTKQNNNVALE